jgi:hypothetical protein
MARKKKKEKKPKKKKGKGTFSKLVSMGSGDEHPIEEKMEYETPSFSLGAGEKKVGEKVDRSNDKLFLGSDYREVYVDDRPWAEILTDIEHWTPLPYTH